MYSYRDSSSDSYRFIISSLPTLHLNTSRSAGSVFWHIKGWELNTIPDRQFPPHLLDEVALFDRGFTQGFSFEPSGPGDTEQDRDDRHRLADNHSDGLDASSIPWTRSP
jgi:hypothetical protein